MLQAASNASPKFIALMGICPPASEQSGSPTLKLQASCATVSEIAVFLVTIVMNLGGCLLQWLSDKYRKAGYTNTNGNILITNNLHINAVTP